MGNWFSSFSILVKDRKVENPILLSSLIICYFAMLGAMMICYFFMIGAIWTIKKIIFASIVTLAVVTLAIQILAFTIAVLLVIPFLGISATASLLMRGIGRYGLFTDGISFEFSGPGKILKKRR